MTLVKLSADFQILQPKMYKPSTTLINIHVLVWKPEVLFILRSILKYYIFSLLGNFWKNALFKENYRDHLLITNLY